MFQYSTKLALPKYTVMTQVRSLESVLFMPNEKLKNLPLKVWTHVIALELITRQLKYRYIITRSMERLNVIQSK
jgi:hypothetical protein